MGPSRTLPPVRDDTRTPSRAMHTQQDTTTEPTAPDALPGITAARIGSDARVTTQSMLGLQVAAFNRELEGTGIRPRYARMPDGEQIVVSSLPKEVREFARECLVVVGIPRMVAIATFGKDGDAASAVRELRRIAMPQAASRMDGDGNETALPDGVVFFPMPEALDAPPDDLTAEGLDGPPVAVVPMLPEAKQSALAALKSSLQPR
jgi:hypothetical protein